MSSNTETLTPSEWRQGWKILPPSLAGIILCAVHQYTVGVMIVPLEREFGWLRSEISAGPLIVAVIALFVAPFVGSGIDRFGPRRIGLFGILFFCAALALLSTATSSIWSWWGLWCFMALANMFVIPTVWTAAINGYFSKNRGMALAIALSGTGITATIIPSLTNFLVDAVGWRGAYLSLAVLCVTIVFPIAWFMFYSAGSRPSAPHSEHSTPPPANYGYSPREGLTSPTFIKLVAAIGVFSVALSAMTTNAVPVLLGQGMSPVRAAGLAGLVGIGSITGRLCGGFLLDRLNANKVAAFSVMLPTLSVALLLIFPGSVPGTALACFLFGLSVGTEVDACAYLVARHFGLRSFGTLFGTINGLFLFSTGIGPILANYIYDVTKSYDLVLWGVIPVCTVAALLFYCLGPYPEFDQSSAADNTAV